MGATVTRNGKTYYKGDDGKLYPDYNAAARATESRRMAQPYLNNQTPGNVADQRSSMLAAASGARINLKDAFLGSPVPGGAAYGAVRDGRQVLVQRGAAGTGANNAGSINFGGQVLDPLTVGRDVMWIPRNGKPTEMENRYGIPVGRDEQEPSKPEPVLDPGPGLGAPTVYGDPAARARESEQRRMMQQYASKEYWGTEQGKAMLALGNQDRYTGQDLGGFYKAQGAVGIGSFDEVIGGLAQLDDRYKEGGDLRKWAEANKTLALREYMKRVPQGQAPDPSQGDIKAAMDQGKFYAPENSPNPLGERSQLVAGVDPGITMGPPAGVNGVLNRQQTAAIQATIPQAAATDTGTKAMNMQPSSAMAAGYQQPARPIAPGNMPDDVGAALDPNAVAVRELWKRKIQGAAQYQGG